MYCSFEEEKIERKKSLLKLVEGRVIYSIEVSVCNLVYMSRVKCILKILNIGE